MAIANLEARRPGRVSPGANWTAAGAGDELAADSGLLRWKETGSALDGGWPPGGRVSRQAAVKTT
jgi:hypothetical protein